MRTLSGAVTRHHRQALPGRRGGLATARRVRSGQVRSGLESLHEMEYAPAVRTARTTRPTVVKCTSRNPSAICWELYSPAAWAATIAASRSLRPANFASGSRRGGLLMDGVSVRIPGMQLFRLDPLSCYLHDCSDCYQPERSGPGGIRTRRKSADFARRTSNSGRLEWLQCKLASNTGFAITQAPGNSLDGSEVRSSAITAGGHRRDKRQEYCQQLPFALRASRKILPYKTSCHRPVKRYLKHARICSYSRTESVRGTSSSHAPAATI